MQFFVDKVSQCVEASGLEVLTRGESKTEMIEQHIANRLSVGLAFLCVFAPLRDAPRFE